MELDEAMTVAIASCLPRCGDCSHWMKSSECPREHNVKGMSRGPSCDGMACDKFSPKNAETAVRVAAKRAVFDQHVARMAAK